MAFNLTATLKLIDSASPTLGKVMRGFSAVTVAVTALGSAMAVVSSAKKAMDFEAQLSTIQALTGATNEQMKEMSDLSLKMGASTKYNALEAAQGIEELLKAGLTPATVKAGGLEAALNLATAGGLGLADAAEIMSTALNAYKKDGMKAADAANILAGTANASATGVEDLRYSLAAVSAVAAGVGMTFRDTNIAMGLFANNGLKGSDAGTSLKTMLSNLQPTTKDQIALFKRLGIVTKSGGNLFYDSKDKLKSLDQVAGILRKSLEKLTDRQRMLALETMFGSDAIRAATILYNEGADGVKNFQQEMSKVTALDVAKKKMDNAKGAVEQLQGAIETMQITALTPLLPTIKKVALVFADMAEQYTPQITAAFERMSAVIDEFLSPYLNNAQTFKVTTHAELKFKQLEMAEPGNKMPPVFQRMVDGIDTWLENGGSKQLENAIESMTQVLLRAIEASAKPLSKAALQLGSKVALSVSMGIRDGMNDSPLGTALLNSIPGVNVFNAGANVYDLVNGNNKENGSKEYHGLSRVPYDGYRAILHKNEMVLNSRDADKYRNPGYQPSFTTESQYEKVAYQPSITVSAPQYSVSSQMGTPDSRERSSAIGGSPVVNVTMNGVTIREEADVERIAKQIAQNIAR